MSQDSNQSQKTPETTPQERIAQFIAAVEGSLSEAGVSNDERQNVTADLRVQIEEMLSARTGGKPPTLEDVQAVLAELDPPESYCETAPGESQKPQPAEEFCCGPRDGRSRGHGHHRGHWGGKWFWRRRHVAQAIRQAIGSFSPQFSPLGNPLFAGFTHRSRAALAIAKNEARSMGHEYIGTEHLLLGLLLEGTGVAAKVLFDLGVTVDTARQEITRLVPPGRSAVTAERLPLTPRLRQAIEEARLAARNLHHDFLGTEHLLMGLMDVPGVAAESLKTLGLNSQQVKDAILQRIPAWTEETAPAGGFTYWPASAAQTLNIGKNQYRIIASGADTGGFYAAVEANLCEPDGFGTRTFPRDDISIYLLEGTLQLRLDHRTIALSKGDFARIPRGTPHEITPLESGVRAMLIGTSAGFEKLLSTMAKAPDSQAMRQAAISYGVIFESN
jgi:mannose-6-phosphate isomerase-like protein (cupin superfamily)